MRTICIDDTEKESGGTVPCPSLNGRKLGRKYSITRTRSDASKFSGTSERFSNHNSSKFRKRQLALLGGKTRLDSYKRGLFAQSRPNCILKE